MTRDDQPDRPNPAADDWKLERYLLGELTPSAHELITQRLSTEPALAQRLEALRASNAQILEDHPPARVAASIRAASIGAGTERGRAAQRESGAARWLWVPALAAAALVVVLVRPTAPLSWPSATPSVGGTPPALDPGNRAKGLEPVLRVYRKGDAQRKPLANQSVVRTGDLLQLAVVPAEFAYGVIVSLDGNGLVTLHRPATRNGTTAFGRAGGDRAGGEIVLPESYELDDAPQFERFVLVASDAPLSVQAVLDAARELAQDVSAARNDPLPLSGDHSRGGHSRGGHSPGARNPGANGFDRELPEGELPGRAADGRAGASRVVQVSVLLLKGEPR